MERYTPSKITRRNFIALFTATAIASCTDYKGTTTPDSAQQYEPTPQGLLFFTQRTMIEVFEAEKRFIKPPSETSQIEPSAVVFGDKNRSYAMTVSKENPTYGGYNRTILENEGLKAAEYTIYEDRVTKSEPNNKGRMDTRVLNKKEISELTAKIEATKKAWIALESTRS